MLTNDSDPDSGDTRTVTAVGNSALAVGQPFTGTFGTFIMSADGTWTYTLDNTDDDTEALAQGEIGVGTVAYTITDANGSNSTATLSITIIGTNDAPDRARG